MTFNTSKTSLEDLQKMIRKFCDDRNWGQFHNPKDLAISLSLESAEVLEHFQWMNDEEMEIHSKEKKEDIAEELADVFYWTLLISNKLDIDLVESFMKKMAKNESKYPVEKAKNSHKKYTEFAE